jgi:hypothetical protein
MKIKFIILLLLSWQSVCSQSFYKVAEDYFRKSPFKTDFSQFINNLLNDPALVEKDISKKTDSTLFYLQGIYRSHSPFFFPSIRCKIILAEQQEYTDSLATDTYTYFTYQLIGYAQPGEEGLEDIKQEYEKLNRKLKKGFDGTNQKDLKRGSEQSGAVTNYLFNNIIFHPLTIAWASSPDKKDNILALSIRFFVIDNKAYLPVPPDSP